MIHKNCEAEIPRERILNTDDEKLLNFISSDIVPKVRAEVDRYKIHRALEEIWRGVGEANAYVDAQAPWTLRKEDPVRMQAVLYTLAEAIRCLAILAQPVTPIAAGKILDHRGRTDNLQSWGARFRVGGICFGRRGVRSMSAADKDQTNQQPSGQEGIRFHSRFSKV